MKKSFKIITYRILTVLAFLVFISPQFASATFFDVFFNIPYIVTDINIPPVANAGVDRTVILPANSITIPIGGSTATDADGTVTSANWTQVSGPNTATITNGSALIPKPTFSNLILGTYTFRLTVIDDQGASLPTGVDDMLVNVINPLDVSANLIAIPNNLPQGGGTTDLTWSSQNADTCTSPDFNTNNDRSGGPVTVYLSSTYTFTLNCSGPGGTATATATVTVSAVNTNYECSDGLDNDRDGKIDYGNDPGCTSLTDNDENNEFSISYECSDTFDNDRDGKIDYPSDLGCTSLTDNDEYNGLPTSYECSDGADNDRDGKIDYPSDLGCTSLTDNNEDDVSSKPACSDGNDNDRDTFIDSLDPGCHSDKTVHTDPLETYLPLKDSEKDSIKPIFIEI